MKKNRRKKNSYNGWKNWETWNVVLWITNDYDLYKQMQRAVRDGDEPMDADAAREFVEEVFPDGTPDMRDIATEVAYRKVDWESVADAFNEEWEGERERNGLRRGIVNKKKGGGFPWAVWGPVGHGGRSTWLGLVCLSFPADGDREMLTPAQEDEIAKKLSGIGIATQEDQLIDKGDSIEIEDDDGKEVCSLDGYPEDDCPLDDPNFSEDYYETQGTAEDREFAKGFEIGKRLWRKPNGLRRVFEPPPPPPPPRPTYTTPQKMRLRYERNGEYLPAWDVKVRDSGVFDPDAIRKRFKCSQKQAEKAVQWAWEMRQERWWEDAQESAEYHLGKLHPNVKVESDGRSGGWCVLKGLPEIYDKNAPIEDSFDEETIKALAEFEKDILGEIEFNLSDRDGLEEDIDANGWCKP